MDFIVENRLIFPIMLFFFTLLFYAFGVYNYIHLTFVSIVIAISLFISYINYKKRHRELEEMNE